MKQHELNNIVEQCKAGNQAAFAQLVVTYQNMVFALSLKMLCDEDTAQDVVQETFIRVWQHIGSYKAGNAKLSTWIYTIAYRLCVDLLKCNKKYHEVRPQDENMFKHYVSTLNQERQLMNQEWIAIVKVLARQLSTMQRTVFTLCILENMEHAEVETITGYSSQQIKSNLHIARNKIKEQLKALGYGQD